MIDTRNKRSSAIMVGLPWRGMYPVPDGMIDVGDRMEVAWLYAGIGASIGIFGQLCGTLIVSPLFSGTLSTNPLLQGELTVGCQA